MKGRIITVLALAFLMLIILAACSPADTPQGTTLPSDTPTGDTNTPAVDDPPAPQEIVHITGLSTYGTNAVSIQMATWYTDVLRDELGIVLDFMDSSGADMEQLVMSLKAARDLPDIICFGAAMDLNNAAEAGLLLNLEDHKDKLPNVFGDHFQHAVTFYKENRSGGRDGLYGMPTEVGMQNSINFNPQLRWDVYQDIGAPSINDLEDYLPVLRQMLDANPTSPDGQRNYGISVHSEWDGNNMLFASALTAIYGWDSEYVNPFVEVRVDANGDIRSILDDESTYKRFLKWYFDANQLGVLDPDSATQTWSTLDDKFKQGTVFFAPWEWATGGFNVLEHTDVDDFSGYQPVWAGDFKISIYPDSTTGRDWSMSVSESPTNLDAVLKYFDFMYSFEGMDLTMNGPAGVLWDVGSDGKRFRTEQGWNVLQNDLELPGGGRLIDAMNIINSSTITNDTINPASGQPMNSALWDDVLGRDPTKLVADWREKNDGYLNSLAMGISRGQTMKSHPAVNMVAPVPDDLQTLMGHIGSIVQTNSWLMIFAANEAEFESIWKETQDNATALGIDEIIEWSTREWAAAIENASKYS